MNSYKTWNNYCDVANIPVGKWVHCALVFKKNALEVYINGNIKNRLNFEGTVPYQNFGDYYFFSNVKVDIPSSNTCIDENVKFMGSFRGLLSRVIYYNYALSYSEIKAALNDGPSNKVESSNIGGTPPYLTDNWWVRNSA